MITLNLQLLLFGVIFINFINLSSSTLSSTKGNNNKYGWELDNIKYCEKKQVTIRNEINVLVKICVLDEEKAFVHPVFFVKYLNFAQFKYDKFYGTWQNKLKVDFFPKEVLKKVKQFPYHAHRKVEFMKIDAVRFVMQTFQSVPKNMKPCFFLGPKNWKVMTENETSATLSLYSSKKKDDCFNTLSRSDVISAVSVEYQVKLKDNKINNFYGNLIIVKKSKTKMTIQRRSSDSVSFVKTWKDYVKGFGDANDNFWLGLEKIHQLTKTGRYNLRMEAKTFVNDTLWFANYDTFIVGSSADYYRLSINKLLDTNIAKESTHGLMYYNNQKFSTFDSDNDGWSNGSCSLVNQDSGSQIIVVTLTQTESGIQ